MSVTDEQLERMHKLLEEMKDLDQATQAKPAVTSKTGKKWDPVEGILKQELELTGLCKVEFAHPYLQTTYFLKLL